MSDLDAAICARLDDDDYATMPEYGQVRDALRAVLDLCGGHSPMPQPGHTMHLDNCWPCSVRRVIAEHLGVTDGQ